MKQAPDEITIVTRTPARADELKQAITLRGFDEIACLDARTASHACQLNPPVLVIVDMEGDQALTVGFLESLPAGVKSMVLTDKFDESLFLSCHDLGARDFMVNPVPEALLVSRVIRNLQDHRLEQVAGQKDQVLVEMGVLSAQSGVLTTSYFINLLRRQIEEEANSGSGPTSLLILQLEGYRSPLSPLSRAVMMSRVGAIIKECARGLDEAGEYFVDKFAVIMPQTSRRGAKALANRLLQRLSGMSFEGPQGPWTLSVRAGVAQYEGCHHYEDLLNLALEDLKGIPAQAVAAAGPVAAPVYSPMPSSQPPQNIPPMSRPSNLI